MYMYIHVHVCIYIVQYLRKYAGAVNYERLTLCSSLHMSPPIERLRAVRPSASLAYSWAPEARRVVAVATWLFRLA